MGARHRRAHDRIEHEPHVRELRLAPTMGKVVHVAIERVHLAGEKGEHVRSTLPRHKRGQWIGPGRNNKATAPDAQGVVTLSPHEFLDRLADLVPPPRKHRHRYHGVFAPNHPLRPAVTALAVGNVRTSSVTATGLLIHRRLDAHMVASQFSTLNPAMRPNSLGLSVTNTATTEARTTSSAGWQ